MSSRTIYVYNEITGEINYTVDEVSDVQIESFKSKGIPIFVSHPRHMIAGTYVMKDAITGNPIGVAPMRHMDFLSLSKETIVANGTDETVISGLSNGMFVDINGEQSYTVDGDSGPTLEISANGFSYDANYNGMVIYLHAYGYNNAKIIIGLVEGE